MQIGNAMKSGQHAKLVDGSCPSHDTRIGGATPGSGLTRSAVMHILRTAKTAGRIKNLTR